MKRIILNNVVIPAKETNDPESFELPSAFLYYEEYLKYSIEPIPLQAYIFEVAKLIFHDKDLEDKAIKNLFRQINILDAENENIFNKLNEAYKTVCSKL